MYSSSLQYSLLGHACQYNTQAGESRIHTISSSTEGLPNQPFMNHHCPCFIRRFGKTMEEVYTRENNFKTTTKVSTMETTSSKLSTLSITGRLTNLDGIYTSYKPLILTATQLPKREPSFNGMSPFANVQREASYPS